MATSNPFDATKKYSELNFQDGQFVVAGDFNHVQSIEQWQEEGFGKYFVGFALRINHMTNTPVLKVRANDDLTEGQVIQIEFTAATTVRWRKNSGAWTGGIAITKDNVTWNTIGTSGVDAVFLSSATTGDVSEVWVAQGMRLLGGQMVDTGAGSELRLAAGHWVLAGRYVELDSQVVAGVADNDYIYLRITESEVNALSDPDIGHRLADGNYAKTSPTATQKVYTLLTSAAFPNNTTTPYAEYVILGKADVTMTVVTPTYMWPDPYDMQKFLREKGDTTAPSAPTGLTLTTGSEESLMIPTTDVALYPTAMGWLTMTCTVSSEPDIMMYEFKVCTINNVGTILNSTTYAVYPNTNAGGAGIPTGVTYTLHNQKVGVKYRVFVRAYDTSGNVGTWSAGVDETIGGTCAIAGGAAGPTFTLVDGNSTGFPGVIVNVSALPANGVGYSVYIEEGAYPTIPAGFYGTYLSTVTRVKIPWDEKGSPYIRLKAFDAKGLYQTLYSQATIDLAESIQFSVSNHNTNIQAHGGTIADVIQSQGPYGSIYAWLRELENNAIAFANVYIVATRGSTYNSLLSALAQVQSDNPTYAVVFVMPGTFDSGVLPVTIPLIDGKISIIGTGVSVIDAPIILSAVNPLTIPGGFCISDRYCKVEFHNITFTNTSGITGTKTSDIGSVLFDNCTFHIDSDTAPCLELTGTAPGAWYLKMKNCIMIQEGLYITMHLTSGVTIVADNCQFIQHGFDDSNIVYFETPTGHRVFKNCAFQNVPGGTGVSMEASAAGGPHTVYLYSNAWTNAPTANVTVEDGSVATNTVINASFLTG